MATFPVKYINNNMRGAPQLSGTPGTLLAVLRAFLLTGFGQVTALSVTVAGGIATASLQAGQSFDPYCVVLVEGATPAELNGEARVLTASSTSITWATTAADGPATGSIKIKVAPVGQWEELFAGTATNKAVFRSTDVQGLRFCWWVDDTGTTAARVRGFESMADVNTGTGPFPTDAQISGGGYLSKSSAANATPVRYDLVADSRAILVPISAGVASNANFLISPIRGFGDMKVLRGSGDAYAVAISCHGNSTGTLNGSFDRQASGADAIYLARHISGLGSAAQANSIQYVGANSASGADVSLGMFPSSVDGELKYSGRFIAVAGDNTPRADVPGVLTVPQSNVASMISPRDVLQGTGVLSGRLLLALGVGINTHLDAPRGIALVDITGPWR